MRLSTESADFSLIIKSGPLLNRPDWMRGTIRKRAKDSWTLWWDEPRGAGGKRRQRNKTVKGPKRVAEAELRSILSEIDHGSYIPPNKLTVNDLLRPVYKARWIRWK